MRLLPLLLPILLSSALVSCSTPEKKTPSRVKYLRQGDTLYYYLFESDEHGYRMTVFARTIKNNTLLWKTRIYQGYFDPQFRKDVQIVKLTSLSMKDKQIILTDSKETRYVLDSWSGRLISPLRPMTYQNVL